MDEHNGKKLKYMGCKTSNALRPNIQKQNSLSRRSDSVTKKKKRKKEKKKNKKRKRVQ